MPDYRVSDNPSWQPHRNRAGEVVTITEDQCFAIYKALGIWLEVAPNTPGNAYIRQGVEEARSGFWKIYKSCLLGRLLYEGKAPLIDAPPTVYSAPDYSVEATDE